MSIDMGGIVALSLVALMTTLDASQAVPDTSTPAYVSSAACAECHLEEHAAWTTSHHRWALRQPTAETVLGDFNNAAFEHQNARSRFFRRKGTYFIETNGANGTPAQFEIKYVVRIKPGV